ncbi:MAG: 3-hydroxyisobutyrate dehydrogenase [Acidimicrobiia bacterium]|nr:3-hydroxyisobutyrate dehydrogenase [Acidimicrobiia bacterium]
MTDRIGWIGLGGMGRPMAANVAKAGFPLTVCDIRPEPVAELVALGAASAPDAEAVAGTSEVVFVSLPNKSVSKEVAAQVFGAPERPEIYVELSTLSPATMQALADNAEAAGVTFLDSPVSGNVRARNEGTLSVMAGGDAEAFERITPVLNAFGGNVFHLGPVGAGSIAKISNNLIGLTSMVTAMEGLLLGVRCGIDATQLRDVIMTASGAGPHVLGAAHQYRTRRYRESVTPQAALRLAVKDLELAVELAAEVGLPVHTAEAALNLWREAEEAGMGEAEIFALLDYLEKAR